MKVSELNGAQLGWAAAKAEGLLAFGYETDGERLWITLSTGETKLFSPHINWAVAGPIIEREKITLEWTGEDWMAYIGGRVFAGATRQIAVVWHDEEFFGSTPLIAAMRCYAASKLDDEIDIPQELTTFKT